MLVPNRLHLIPRLVARTGPNSENENGEQIILKFGTAHVTAEILLGSLPSEPGASAENCQNMSFVF